MTITSSIMRVSIGLLSVGVATFGLVVPASAFTMRKGNTFNGYSLSPNRCFELHNQNGNYVIKNRATLDVMWQSGTSGSQTMLRFQPDGNLVVYDESRKQGSKRKSLWASGTDRKTGTIVKLQNDGNFVMYDRSNRPIWATDKFDASYWDQKCR